MTLPHKARTREDANEVVIVSISLSADSLLPLKNGMAVGNRQMFTSFTKMVARRGWLRAMLSDNGTNFVGGHNEICKLVAEIDKEKIKAQTSNKGVEWEVMLRQRVSTTHRLTQRNVGGACRSLFAKRGNAGCKSTLQVLGPDESGLASQKMSRKEIW